MALRTRIPDFEEANPLYAGSEVSFYTVDANGVQTTTRAALYAGPTGAAQLGNPQTLDSEGKFSAPVYIDVDVIASVEGIHVGDHVTGIIRPDPDPSPLEESNIARAAATVAMGEAQRAAKSAAASAAAAAGSVSYEGENPIIANQVFS